PGLHGVGGWGPRRGRAGDPRALGAPAGARRPPGGHLRLRGGDAHDPPRLDRPDVLRARRAPRGQARLHASRSHGRIGTAAGSPARRMTRRIAAVFAHPDDDTYSLAGSAAMHLGDLEMTLVLATSGEAGQIAD